MFFSFRYIPKPNGSVSVRSQLPANVCRYVIFVLQSQIILFTFFFRFVELNKTANMIDIFTLNVAHTHKAVYDMVRSLLYITMHLTTTLTTKLPVKKNITLYVVYFFQGCPHRRRRRPRHWNRTFTTSSLISTVSIFFSYF